MEVALLPVSDIKRMNKEEIEHAHAAAFKALHEGMYNNAPPHELDILRANFNNLDSISTSGHLTN